MERVLIKLLLEDKPEVMIFAERFINQLTELKKIYCNIYKNRELTTGKNNNIHRKNNKIYRLEANRTLCSFSKSKALQLLTKRFDEGLPFFIDIFSSAEKSLSIIRIETKLLFYVVLEKNKFEKEREMLLGMIHNLFMAELGIRAYISSVEDNWFYPKSKISIIEYWRHLMYHQYNTEIYNRERALDRLKLDEVWQPSCWAMWFSEKHHEEMIDKLFRYKFCVSKIRLNQQSVFLQLYDNISNFDLPANQMKCREFSLYLAQFYPFEW